MPVIIVTGVVFDASLAKDPSAKAVSTLANHAPFNARLRDEGQSPKRPAPWPSVPLEPQRRNHSMVSCVEKNGLSLVAIESLMIVLAKVRLNQFLLVALSGCSGFALTPHS